MNQLSRPFWNALLSAIAVTVLGALLLLGLPQQYRATAAIEGDASDLVTLRSADFLSDIVGDVDMPTNVLNSWQDQWLGIERTTINLLVDAVEYHRTSNGLIEINVTSRNPEFSATLANRIAKAYLTAHRHPSDAATTDPEASLLKNQLDLAKTTLAQQPPEKLVNRQLDRVNSILDTLHAQQRQVEQEINALAAGDQDAYANSRSLARLLSERREVVEKLTRLGTRYGPRHQSIIAASQQRDAFHQQIEESVQQVLARQRADLLDVKHHITTRKDERGSLVDALKARRTLEAQILTLEEKLNVTINTDGHQPEFAAAVVPEGALGIHSMTTLLVVFLTAFVLIFTINLLLQRQHA